MPIDDVIELEQLLARYAVGMTKDDIDAVVEVFTPTAPTAPSATPIRSADFPALVAAAPKGSSWWAHPLLDLDGDTSGTGQQPLCFVEQTNHDMRIGYYTDTYRRTRRLAPAHPLHDLPAQERGPRLGSGPRPDPPPAPPVTRPAAMDLDDFRSVAGRSWLDDNQHLTPGIRYRAAERSTSRWPSWPRSSGSPTTPAGCAGAGRSGSGASAGRPCCAPTSARPSPPGTSSSPASTP
jgi:hypothetical protein